MVTGVIKLFDTHKKYTYCYLGGQPGVKIFIIAQEEYLAMLLNKRNI